MRLLNFGLLACFCLLASIAFGQNFAFSPSNEVFTDLNLNEYRDTQVNIDPNTDQTFAMSWRMVGNTCPESWDIVLCDWSECYTYLPNNGDMDPINQGQTGLIKLTVNPFETAGSGYVRFWVYPTGDMDSYQDLYFYYETTFTSVPDLNEEKGQIIYDLENKIVTLLDYPSTDFFLFNANGQSVDQFLCSSSSFTFLLNSIPSGIYFLTDRKRISLKLIVQ